MRPPPTLTMVHLSITAVDLSTSTLLPTATSGGEVDSTSSMVLAAAYSNDSQLVVPADKSILDSQAIIERGFNLIQCPLFNSFRLANKNCDYIGPMSSNSSALLSKLCAGCRSLRLK
jgi:hypothetical protein